MARPRRKDVGPRTFAADAARRDRRLHSRGAGTGAVKSTLRREEMSRQIPVEREAKLYTLGG